MLTTRYKYYVEKIKWARRDGTLGQRMRRKIAVGAATRLSAVKGYVALRSDDRRMSCADGFDDESQNLSIDKDHERAILLRIIAAYDAATQDRKSAPARYQSRGLWAEWIQVNYGALLTAIRKRNVEGLRALLSNFERESFAVGTGCSYDDLVRYKTSVVGRAYVKTVWCAYRDVLADSGFDLSLLKYPAIGRPTGFRVNDYMVPTEALRHAYNGHAIGNLLRDVPAAVIAEIGGSFGSQAFQVVSQLRERRNPVGKYLDFDLPEVQIVASYFLLRAFPELTVRLYGEGAVSTNSSERFDIGIFPHFTIEQMPERSVDLVFNSNSFSEMDRNASRGYVSVINRICRKYFMHVNHESRLVFRRLST